MYTYSIRSDELYHFGIKGMHWGIRRYQNADGSLTSAGRKHYKREQKKAQRKYDKDLNKAYTSLYVEAYNKTADEYNNGKIAEYNRKHKPSDPDYESGYEKAFSRDLQKNYKEVITTFNNNNKNYQRAKEIQDKLKNMPIKEMKSK